MEIVAFVIPTNFAYCFFCTLYPNFNLFRNPAQHGQAGPELTVTQNCRQKQTKRSRETNIECFAQDEREAKVILNLWREKVGKILAISWQSSFEKQNLPSGNFDTFRYRQLIVGPACPNQMVFAKTMMPTKPLTDWRPRGKTIGR